MKPIITIPSYNRPDSKIFDKLIPIRLEKFVFVRKNQYEDYVHLQEKNFRVITIPTSIEEIGKTRRYIVYWCQKHGYKWAFMFDDDISKVECLGSYKNSRKIGNEDLYIIYQLMTQGYKVGKVGLVEYDCAAMGNIEDGTSDSFQEKYERFVRCFKKNVCDDPKLIGVKTTSTGVPSIQFKWKNWGGYDINLEESDE